ncbi:MAG: phage tail protein [Actinomycetota bacterium]
MEPFVGQIKTWGFSFNPQGYALCNGATLNIQQNAALYSLIGVQFGGNASTTFLLPDLRGRVPLGADYTRSQYLQGHTGGAETVALVAGNMPAHTHVMNASNTPAAFPLPGTTSELAQPGNWGNGSAIQLYGPNAAPVALAADAIAVTGAGAGHNNMQPYQVLNFCIALTGYYPSRN